MKTNEMKAGPALFQHGAYISPRYRRGARRDFAMPNVPAHLQHAQPDIFQHYEKRVSIATRPEALGWIMTIYRGAIQYSRKTKQLRGFTFMIACTFPPVLLAISVQLILGALHFADWFTWLLLPPVATVFSLAAIWQGVLLVRLDLFQPRDQPVIFDRDHRRVYRLFSEQQRGFVGAMKPWPLRACAYEWDLIEARHEAERVATGATVMTNHFLMFAIRKSASDPTIIDSFQIANAISLSDSLVDAMWEHIRRFMEEDGPHLPTPYEPLADQTPPPNWWQSLAATGVYGPGYLERWKENPLFMLLMHLAFPLTIPVYLLWGTGNWLSYKTEIQVDWPDEVKVAVGEAVRSG